MNDKRETSTELRIKELLRERRWSTKVLADKTGMSESYLTHIKNGTRRWNEDALRKMADAFGICPTEMLAQRKGRTDNVELQVKLPENVDHKFTCKVVPVVGKIPLEPSPLNNQVEQYSSGYQNEFVPVLGNEDPSMFCLAVDDDCMAPFFNQGDRVIISPQKAVRSGDIAAVEYAKDAEKKYGIFKISYMENFMVLDSVNHKQAPVALIKGKDHYRVIGKVIYRYQSIENPEPTQEG